eukprot:scaffold16695_cov72-Isochrysis_galbana.AAC.3
MGVKWGGAGRGEVEERGGGGRGITSMSEHWLLGRGGNGYGGMGRLWSLAPTCSQIPNSSIPTTAKKLITSNMSTVIHHRMGAILSTSGRNRLVYGVTQARRMASSSSGTKDQSKGERLVVGWRPGRWMA